MNATSASWNSAEQFATSNKAKSFYDKLMSYTTDDDGNYTLTMKWDSHYGAVQEVTDGTPAVSAAVTFTNGSAYVKLNDTIKIQMTDETVVLVRGSDKAPFATYTSYTGYDNIPSMKGKVWYHIDGDTKKADVIYVYDVSVSGTETVIFYKGDNRVSGKPDSDGKYPLEFTAYALDKDTGSLTEQTYIYKASRTALSTAETGFYTAYVNDKNEVTFKEYVPGTGSAAGTMTDTPKVDATTAVGYAAEVSGTAVLQVGALVIDGGTKDITAYSLSKIEALDYDKVEAGDLLYVYKNKDNGKFTVVDAVDVATVKFYNEAGDEIKGTATEQTIGHGWEAMTVTSIEAGSLKTIKSVTMYTDAAMTAGAVTVMNPDKAQPSVPVLPYIKVVVNDDPAYTALGLKLSDVLGGWGVVTTAPVAKTASAPAVEGKIKLNVGTVVKASQIAADVAGKIAENKSDATVAVYSANGVMADAEATLIANNTAGDNYSTWYLMLTAKNGDSVKVTFSLT